MMQTVTIPIWAFVLILLFAAVTFASHFLFPSVRWFFRKRAERVIAKLNTRLQRPIEPFKLARRHDMIQRLIYDPEVTQAIVDHAKSENVPENVAFEMARRYAREIVPSFSATAYFTFGLRIAKWLSRSFYRIRLGAFDRDALEALDPDATIVFVMNHRSNMDYVLVTHLVSRAGALSYAVGEWARIWPLSAVIRSMGAYFIRRKSRGALYRKVLARYVYMATQGGVTQAVFPEGGLSLTGKLEKPKLGLLSYIVESYAQGGKDVIFVPVGLNYDRVFEDRFLVKADAMGVRKFRPPVTTMISGCLGHLRDVLLRRFKGFGTASVGVGVPLELSKFAATADDITEDVAAELMRRIADVVPVLSGPLVAYAILQGGGSRDAILDAVDKALAQLSDKGMPLPRRGAADVVDDMLSRFAKRDLVRESGGVIAPTADGSGVLHYYANTIAHHFDADAALQVEISAFAK